MDNKIGIYGARENNLKNISLDIPKNKLSGGEAQRIKLAKELGSCYNGNTLYLLDEPTTGLHPHDTAKLARVLDELAAAGNTVVVIEHNLDLINMADHIIDFGPEGGSRGGYVMAEGTPEKIMQNRQSHTGRYLLLPSAAINPEFHSSFLFFIGRRQIICI